MQLFHLENFVKIFLFFTILIILYSDPKQKVLKNFTHPFAAW